MATLLKAAGRDWTLEVVGRVPELPSFISIVPQWQVLTSPGLSSIEALDTATNQLVSATNDTLLAPLFFEGVRYDIHFEKEVGCRATVDLPLTAELRRARPNSEHYDFQTGNNVGFFSIRVKDCSSIVEMRLEVFSRKVDYRKDYIAMRNDVSSMLRNLAMTANAKTFGLAKPNPAHSPTLIEWFALLKEHHVELIRVAAAITRHPHTNLIDQSRLRHADRARRISRSALDAAIRSGSATHAIPALGIAVPRTLVEKSKHVTVNTPENRFYKAALKYTARNIKRLAMVEATGDEDAEPAGEARFFESIRSELGTMAAKIDALLTAPFLRDVSDTTMVRPTSMVINKHPAYSRFDRLARLLNGGLAFLGNVVPIGVKDTALLYEYWCFLKMVSILGNRFQLEQQSIVKINRYRTVVTLAKGKSAAIRFTHRATNKQLYVVYNKLFNRLPTINQKPDNVIQLASEGKFYVFDAKYRLQFDDDYIKQYGGAGPTTDDINTMHRYRDAIVIPHPMNPAEYQTGVVIGASVLFPYPHEKEYCAHRFYRSLDAVGIGGIPFMPGATSLLEEKLTLLLATEYPDADANLVYCS